MPSNKNLNDRKLLQRLRFSYILLALSLSLLYIVACKHAMTSDGMSYLDMARGYANGDISKLINPIWSPLYPMILGSFLYVLKPSGYFEFTLIHFIDYFIFILSLFSFDFFLQTLVSMPKKNDKSFYSIPPWAILTLGYIIFIQASINLITLWKVTPDLLLSIFIYLSFGIIIKLSKDNNNINLYILLGLCFGIGYLAKAAMLPISLIILFFYTQTNKTEIKVLFKISISILIFALIAAPYVKTLSDQQSHLTFGESGKLNYAWYANDVPHFTHWQGDNTTGAVPKHTTRKIFNKPAIYEFKSPISSTYPPWFNPDYWYKGIKPKFNLSKQINAIYNNLEHYVQLFIHQQIAIIFGLFILYYLAKEKRWNTLLEIYNNKLLIFPPIICFILFSLIHFEARYFAALLTVFWLGLFISIKVEDSDFNKNSISYCCSAIAAIIMLNSGTRIIREIYNWHKNDNGHIEWQIANNLKSLGIKEGNSVATIGYEVPQSPYWASIAKVNVIAEITEKDASDFWQADNDTRINTLRAFHYTGAQAIISKVAPRNCVEEGWKPLPPSKSYVLFLN